MRRRCRRLVVQVSPELPWQFGGVATKWPRGAALGVEAGSFLFVFVRIAMCHFGIWRRPPPVLRTYSPKALPRLGGDAAICSLFVCGDFGDVRRCKSIASESVQGSGLLADADLPSFFQTLIDHCDVRACVRRRWSIDP